MSGARFLPWLSLGVLAAAVAIGPGAAGVTEPRERLQISAPILPDVLAIYKPFPSTLDGEKAMAHEAALIYDRLLPECAPDYPAITLPPADGTPLSPEQLGANYDAVADCSYAKHTAKPYWIPKLIDDVDICGTELGAGWRLIAEDDVLSLTERDFQFIADTLTPLAAGSTSSLGPWYFGLNIWVRGHDGSLKKANLEPGLAGDRVAPLPGQISVTDHYEGGLALRCIRRTDLP